MTAIFLKIISMSITASVVIAVTILLRLALKKAPKIFSYILWAAALFRLLCPFSFEIGCAPVTPLSLKTVNRNEYISAPNTFETETAIEIYDYGEIVIYTSENENAPVYRKAKQTVDYLSYIWAAGVICMTACGTVSYFRLRKRLKNTVCVDGFYQSDKIINPFIMGILRPKVYIPAGLDEKERKIIITHEKTHLQRFDHIAKIIMYIALCVHWFNPLVWMMFRLFERDMEMSCDEKVTSKMTESERADYTQTLLNISARPTATFTACFGENGTKQRIKNVLTFKKPAVWVIILATVIISSSMIVLIANRTVSASFAVGETIMNEPPVITVGDPLSSTFPSSMDIQPSGYEWIYVSETGNTSKFIAQSTTPEENLQADEIKLIANMCTIKKFPNPCDKVILRGWNISDNGSLPSLETVNVERVFRTEDEYNGVFELEHNTLYCITAVWDSENLDKRGFSGSADYYFRTENFSEKESTKETTIMNDMKFDDFSYATVTKQGTDVTVKADNFAELFYAVSSADYTRINEDLRNISEITEVAFYVSEYNYVIYWLGEMDERYFLTIATTNSIHNYEMSKNDYDNIKSECEKVLLI